MYFSDRVVAYFSGESSTGAAAIAPQRRDSPSITRRGVFLFLFFPSWQDQKIYVTGSFFQQVLPFLIPDGKYCIWKCKTPYIIPCRQLSDLEASYSATLHFVDQLYFSVFLSSICQTASTVFSDCCQTCEHLADPGGQFIGLARPCLVCCFYGRQRQRPRNAKSLRPTSFSNISNDMNISNIYISPNRKIALQRALKCTNHQLQKTRIIGAHWLWALRACLTLSFTAVGRSCHVTHADVSMMHVSIMQYACIHDACIHNDCSHDVSVHNACIHDA